MKGSTLSQKPTCLLICYVWPEPQSSAAGLRDRNLIEGLCALGYQVVIASAAQNELGLEACQEWARRSSQVSVQPVLLNDSSFDRWVCEQAPELVIFDRFVCEEQFGSRVRAAVPSATFVLDTQDLHFLRSSREKLLRQELRESRAGRVVSGTPEQWDFEAMCREMASIHRVDQTLLISDFEKSLLVDTLGVEDLRLSLLRFAYPIRERAAEFGRRRGFVLLGNFRHAPNLDAFRWVRRELWPAIRRRLPKAELQVFGAYATQEVFEANSPAEGFRVVGRAESLTQAFAEARVALAPLRFGAGIKGKVSDAWWHGLPVVGTSIAAEGMGRAFRWGGRIADEAGDFVDACVSLHEDEMAWRTARDAGGVILDEDFSEKGFRAALKEALDRAQKQRERRRFDWMRGMLLQSTTDAYRYFGKWLELKQRGGSKQC